MVHNHSANKFYNWFAVKSSQSANVLLAKIFWTVIHHICVIYLQSHMHLLVYYKRYVRMYKVGLTGICQYMIQRSLHTCISVHCFSNLFLFSHASLTAALSSDNNFILSLTSADIGLMGTSFLPNASSASNLIKTY